jgi:hypothetical protein
MTDETRNGRDAAATGSYDSAMPIWRCPHCATPQAESSRCWVCHRSSTSCGTCRYFRGSVAPQIGFCGLDRRRRPLAGDEIRGCWEASPASDLAAVTDVASDGRLVSWGAGGPRAFVSLEPPRPVGPPGEAPLALWGEPDLP